MKVILLKDVKKVGKKDEVVNVKDGYGNNFLIKQGFALLADKEQLNNLDQNIKIRTKEENKEVKHQEKIKKQLEELQFNFSLKGSSEKTFGSISSKQITEELTKHNHKIDKTKLIIDGKINTFGIHFIKIMLHKDVIAKLKIVVKEENE